MKIAALLSGGKDSCYNLVHCTSNGHTLVAAASLGPEPGKEELDSYMYQTVGQDAINYVAQALNVPLYRRVIKGSPVEQRAEYGPRDGTVPPPVVGDETEDLYELLKTVINNHPTIEGVSVGAILSNYQRVRVEHVCRRLGLTPLCYLWQRNQTELLGEMIRNGLEAVIIKVAGAGLMEKHLGKTLAQMEPTLHKLRDLYQTHVCGEGGEYETLTVDCSIYQKRICLGRVECVSLSASDLAPVAYLRINEAYLEKPNEDKASLPPEIPPLLDGKWEQVEASMNASNINNFARAPPPLLAYATQGLPVIVGTKPGRSGVWYSIANVYVPQTHDSSIETECEGCWEQVREKLEEFDLDLMNVSHANVYLSSMAYFPAINAVMYRIFGSSPPTRACVSADLPAPHRVLLDIIAFSNTDQHARHSLHVQSISYWAPANIGPYSQSITIDRQRMFVSGQIGLIPGNMTIPSPPNIAREIVLALQHAERVSSATMDGLAISAHSKIIESAILWMVDEGAVPQIRQAWNAAGEGNTYGLPTALLVGVKELPRAAQVEAQLVYGTGFKHGTDAFDDDDDDSENDLPATRCVSEAFNISETKIKFEVKIPLGSKNDRTIGWLALRNLSSGATEILRQYSEVANALLRSTLHIRAFYTSRMPERSLRQTAEELFGPAAPLTPLPTYFLATSDGEFWDVIFCIL